MPTSTKFEPGDVYFSNQIGTVKSYRHKYRQSTVSLNGVNLNEIDPVTLIGALERCAAIFASMSENPMPGLKFDDVIRRPADEKYVKDDSWFLQTLRDSQILPLQNKDNTNDATKSP